METCLDLDRAFHFRDHYVEDSLTEEEYQKIFPSTHVDLMRMCDDMYTGRTLLVSRDSGNDFGRFSVLGYPTKKRLRS